MDADPPGPAFPAHPRSATALALLSPAPAPLPAPQPREVAATETPTQRNASRMHRSASTCLNRVLPQAPADQVTHTAALIVRCSMERPPSRVINIFAGNRDRPSQKTLLGKKEIQAITAPFGVRTEPGTFQVQLKSTLDTALFHGIIIHCPSLGVVSEVYNALLVEAERPETLPKFVIEFGRETPTPEPRPPPDPTGQ